MNAAGVVIISNPHNPTGAHLDPQDLISVFYAYPAIVTAIECAAGERISRRQPSSR